MARSKKGSSENPAASVTDAAKDTIGAVSDTLSEAVDTATDTATDAITDAKDMVDSDTDVVTETMADAADAATGKATEAVESNQDNPQDAVSDATPAAEDVALSDDATDIATTETDDSLTSDATVRLQGDADAVADPVSDEPKPVADAAPQVIRETVIEKKAGLVPMILGGVIAAGLGFGAAQYGMLNMSGSTDTANPFEEETRASIASQSSEIDSLVARVDETQKAVEIINIAPLTTALAGIEDKLDASTAQIAGLADQVAAFDSRLTAIEKAPLANAVAPEAIAAYERELAELRSDIDGQRAALAQQKTEIEAMAQQAVASETAAKVETTRAKSLAALAGLTNAVQQGRPFADALGVLDENGVALPDALKAVATDGVVTSAALSAEFPDLAREALGIARSQEVAEGGGGIGTFFKNQLGARSVVPRDGNDADAVLSRAEAAAASGDIDTALSEISALPDAAKLVFAVWTEKAEARSAALAAADSLALELNQQ